MKIRRTLPPAAAPLYFSDLWNGFKGFFFGKRYLQNLEQELKEYFGVKHVFLVSSGKAALYLILRVLKSLRPERPEVLIPAYTCFSVPSVIVKVGLKVGLCDINPKNFDFDHNLLKNAINDNTLCVVPDHLFGIPSDMDHIVQLSTDKDVFVVEDAAQAMGGKYKNRLLGTLGDVGFFSLGRGKNITCGSGGVVVSNNDVIGALMEQEWASLDSPNPIETLKNFFAATLISIFIHPLLYWFPAGLSFLRLGETVFYTDFPTKRLSGMKAGLLKNWRKRLNEANETRRKNASNLLKKLDDKNHDEPLVPYLRFPIVLKDSHIREQLLNLTRSKSLGLSILYPNSVNKIKEISNLFNGRDYPRASSVADQIITIPTHQFVKEEDIEFYYSLFDRCYWFGHRPGRKTSFSSLDVLSQ